MSIYTKLLTIQQSLKAPKAQFNKFGGYSYRSCEDIVEAVKPLLAEQKIVLTISDSVQQLGERFYIVATATMTDTETGESVSVTAQAREELSKKGMDSSQITGAASSYARKYALNGLFCIDDTKDSDATNNGDIQPPGPLCSDCKTEIMPYNDGHKSYTAGEMSKRSTEMFGRPLCARCAKAEGKRQVEYMSN